MMLMSITLGLLASCSKSEGEIYDYVPNHAGIVVSIDAKTVLTNADCTIAADGVELSAPMKKLIGDQSIIDFMQAKGLDLDRIAAFIDDNDLFAVARLTDEAKFKEYLTENGLEPTSANIYTKSDICAIVIDNGMAVYLPFVEDVAATVKELKEDGTKKEPLADWQKKFLDSNTASILAKSDNINILKQYSRYIPTVNFEKIMKAIGIDDFEDTYTTYTLTLKGPKLSVTNAMVDKNGNQIIPDVQCSPMNKQLLDYTTKYDVLVALSGLPSTEFFNKIIDATDIPADQRATIKEVYAGFSALMIAVGPIDASAFNTPSGWHAVMAATLKDGKAKDYFNLAKIYAPQIGDAKITGNQIALSSQGIRGYLTLDGDNLVVSLNLPAVTPEKSPITAADFTDGPACMVVDIPANSPSVTLLPLPFGISMQSPAKGTQNTTEIALTDTDGNFLGLILNYIANR